MCVLLVEDDLIISMMAAEVLEDVGHEVLKAMSGRQAVAYIEQMPGRFSCLVSDLYMGSGINGMDVIDHGRRQYPDLPAVLVTALPGDVPLSWLGSQNVTLLAKPYSLGSLVKLVVSLTKLNPA